MQPDPPSFRRQLLRWYERSRRDLPWRANADPWRILVSEIMLQQTRVEAVIPYYQRFLDRFPDAASLAAASEPDVLAAWSGLGYYSRARNLQRAAAMAANGFPPAYEDIRALPGVGPYTAAAVASIAFGLPHAAVDGNVLRVIARVTNDYGDIAAGVTKQRFTRVADELLDPRRPGDFNQAMMELGATVCLPRNPYCLVCPVARNCLARQEGSPQQLPVKRAKAAPTVEIAQVLICRRRDGALLLRQRAVDERRMAGFWELPDPQSVAGDAAPELAASFRHTIVNTAYTVQVFQGRVAGETMELPAAARWVTASELALIPLTTVSKKALARCAAAETGDAACG